MDKNKIFDEFRLLLQTNLTNKSTIIENEYLDMFPYEKRKYPFISILCNIDSLLKQNAFEGRARILVYNTNNEKLKNQKKELLSIIKTKFNRFKISTIRDDSSEIYLKDNNNIDETIFWKAYDLEFKYLNKSVIK